MNTEESMKYKRPTKQTSVLQTKQLFRVSHFNLAGIALTSFVPSSNSLEESLMLVSTLEGSRVNRLLLPPPFLLYL